MKTQGLNILLYGENIVVKPPLFSLHPVVSSLKVVQSLSVKFSVCNLCELGRSCFSLSCGRRILSGNYNYNNGAMNNQGSNGHFWSSSAYSSATNAYNLNFNSSAINPQNNNNKGYGFSVRCVAR